MKRERFLSVTSACVAVLSLFGCSTPSTSASDADQSTASGSTSGGTKSDSDNHGGSTAAAGTSSMSMGLGGLGGAAGRQSGGGASAAAGASAAGAGGRPGAFGTGGKAPTLTDAGGSQGMMNAGSGGMNAGSGGMSAGSGGTTAGGSTVSPAAATWDNVKLVLTGTLPPCNASICHGGNGKISLGFPVTNDAQLYNVLTQYVSKACDNMVLVSPGHPEASALVKVLKGPCSDDVPRMPKDCTEELDNCVPDEYIAAVEQWIADGAKQP